jgi:hypothetical protein
VFHPGLLSVLLLQKMTCNDINSGTLVFNLFYHLLSMTYCVFILLGLILLILLIIFIHVLPWYGFDEHTFAFVYLDLVLIDYVGDRFKCILKFGVDSNDELSCKVFGGWADLCKSHDLAEGDRVRFCITQPPHNYIMCVCILR